MYKYYLISKLKAVETTYLCWIFGCHYAYLGKWGLQFLYWITLGGLGIWCILDLFSIPNKVRFHNSIIIKQIHEAV